MSYSVFPMLASPQLSDTRAMGAANLLPENIHFFSEPADSQRRRPKVPSTDKLRLSWRLYSIKKLLLHRWRAADGIALLQLAMAVFRTQGYVVRVVDEWVGCTKGIVE